MEKGEDVYLVKLEGNLNDLSNCVSIWWLVICYMEAAGSRLCEFPSSLVGFVYPCWSLSDQIHNNESTSANQMLVILSL